MSCFSIDQDLLPYRYNTEMDIARVLGDFGYSFSPVLISGQVADLQSYECQVPPSGKTGDEWKTVICDVNPQNVSGAPKFLKIDLYAYLSPGTVQFDDVQLKLVGEQTRHAVDDALKPPAGK